MEQRLTVEQMQKYWQTLDQITEVNEKLLETNEKIGKIYDIIVGDEFGRKGIINRMDSYEKEAADFRTEILAINRRIDRHENFVKGALWVSGIVGVVVGYFIKAIL